MTFSFTYLTLLKHLEVFIIYSISLSTHVSGVIFGHFEGRACKFWARCKMTIFEIIVIFAAVAIIIIFTITKCHKIAID